VRKLVTLPADLADRVEEFRQTIGASSESDALKTLIEDGLKFRDRPADLLKRFETLVQNNQSIGDIVNLLASEHPLVENTFLDNDSLIVNLKIAADSVDQRFRFSRLDRKWHWEIKTGRYDHDWGPRDADLDDEIPF
jgi:hypothetical protein